MLPDIVTQNRYSIQIFDRLDNNMNKHQLTIATRESPLALRQAEWVKEKLESLHPGLQVRFLGITTSADKMLAIPLAEVGGKGLFVKELEEALLAGQADIAVHSMKDVPMEIPPGLMIPVMCEREDPRDVLVSNEYTSLFTLPKNSIVGTSSVRRQSELRALRPDLDMRTLRGNVNTRLKKLDNGEFSAIILAAAGLIRLGLQDRIREALSLEQCLPAAGQGVLGIECRQNDQTIQELIAPLNHADSFKCVIAERTLCRHLGGNCQVPLAAYAEIMPNQRIQLRGLVASAEGQMILRAAAEDAEDQLEKLGKKVADELLTLGAATILKQYVKKHV